MEILELSLVGILHIPAYQIDYTTGLGPSLPILFWHRSTHSRGDCGSPRRRWARRGPGWWCRSVGWWRWPPSPSDGGQTSEQRHQESSRKWEASCHLFKDWRVTHTHKVWIQTFYKSASSLGVHDSENVPIRCRILGSRFDSKSIWFKNDSRLKKKKKRF